jgi:hypothetical protein
MYFYCYVYVSLLLCMFCSVLYILFLSCQLALFGYPDYCLSAHFPQLYGKCLGIILNDGARSALFPLGDNFYVVGSRLVDHSGFEFQKVFQPKLLIVLYYVLFVCKCVLYYCHRVNPIAVNKYIISTPIQVLCLHCMEVTLPSSMPFVFNHSKQSGNYVQCQFKHSKVLYFAHMCLCDL